VAVIGTGASAIQAVPSIIDKVGHLTLFQRTPAWVLPKPDMRFDAKQQERFEKHPWVQRMIRGGIYAFLETGAFGFTGIVPGLLKRTEWRARKFMEQTIADPVLRSKLTPNYRIGCKRILLSNTYFPALQKPNASVVTAGITEIRENAIVTQDGQEHAVDAIVFATGFEAAEAQAPYELRGRDGRDLNKEWVKGGEGYFGVAVTGFPNFFMLVGPNSGLGNNSMVFMIESQINYVMDALAKMRDRSVQWVDVKPEVQRVYNEKLTQRLKKAIWTTGGCVSWYHTQAGRNTTLWPGFTLEFRLRTRNFDIENYEARPKADVRPDLAAVRSAPELTDNPAE
jgi:cation diffusion facilitator CzcD-associated flavoprotein CzcO